MRRITTGDVIAIAVDGVGLPPVGIVTDCDDDAIALRLYSWISGHFAAGQMLIRRRDIRATLWAEQMSAVDARAAGIHADDDDTIWDMDALGNFQRSWRVL